MRDMSPIPTAALKAARVWLRAAKASGRVSVIGGGWWRVHALRQPVQGYFALARILLNRGVIDQTGAFTGKGLENAGLPLGRSRKE